MSKKSSWTYVIGPTHWSIADIAPVERPPAYSRAFAPSASVGSGRPSNESKSQIFLAADAAAAITPDVPPLYTPHSTIAPESPAASARLTRFQALSRRGGPTIV